MTQRPPSLQGQFLAAALRSLAGSTRWQVVLKATLLLILFSWFTDRLWDVVDKGRWPQPSQWLVLVAFPSILAWMMYLAHSIEKTITPDVQCEVVDRDSIQKVECLILFLSPPGRDSDRIDVLLADEGKKGSLEEARKEMQGSWRMPLEAIHLHEGRLKQVAVVCSADATDKNDGTWREFDRFKKLVMHLSNQKQILIFDAAKEIRQQTDVPEHKKEGVDFEDVAHLVDLVNRVYQRFYEGKIKDSDIMVDITGGQKVPTIAGAAIALAEGRRFQYVSTRDYKVRHYNVTYRGL